MPSVTFDVTGGSPLTVTPIPGSLRQGGGHDDRGGGLLPRNRAGLARSGQVECLVQTSGDQSLANLLALRSGVGPGATSVTGDDVQEAAEALVDVTIRGEAVQTALIAWQGTSPSGS